MDLKLPKVEMKKIWLSSPHMGEAEWKYVQEAFDTNWIAPLGPHVDGFEEAIAQYTGVPNVAVLTSGTAAIHLALVLLDVQPGDVVLCQSMTFCGSANPIRYQGAMPVFIDSEPETWNMDPNALEDALRELTRTGKKPKAIIPVHLYGMPAKMEEIRQIADKYAVPIIEDAAEALGSVYQGKACGSMGIFGVLSFNGNKIITTSGGGALLSQDASYIDRARFLSTQARDPAPHYQHSHIGYNYRLSNVLAAIGRGQMEVLNQRIDQRRRNFSRYEDFFSEWNSSGFDIGFQEEKNGCFSNRWLTCILINPESNKGLTRIALQDSFSANHIDARPLWKPMHLQPVFKDCPFYGAGVSERLFEMGLCLPSGSNLGEDDFDRIFSSVGELLESM